MVPGRPATSLNWDPPARESIRIATQGGWRVPTPRPKVGSLARLRDWRGQRRWISRSKPQRGRLGFRFERFQKLPWYEVEPLRNFILWKLSFSMGYNHFECMKADSVLIFLSDLGRMPMEEIRTEDGERKPLSSCLLPLHDGGQLSRA